MHLTFWEEAQQTETGLKPMKTASRLIIIKRQKSKDKEKILKLEEKKLNSFFDDTVIGFVIYIYECNSQRIYFLVTVAVAGTVHALELPEVQQVMCG